MDTIKKNRIRTVVYSAIGILSVMTFLYLLKGLNINNETRAQVVGAALGSISGVSVALLALFVQLRADRVKRERDAFNLIQTVINSNMNALSHAEFAIKHIQENWERQQIPSLPVRQELEIRYDLTSSMLKDRLANTYAALVAEFRRGNVAIENLWNLYGQIRELAIRTNGTEPAISEMMKGLVDQLPSLQAQIRMTYSLGLDFFAWVSVVHETEPGWIFVLFPNTTITAEQYALFPKKREQAKRGFARVFDEEMERRSQSGFTPPKDMDFNPPD